MITANRKTQLGRICEIVDQMKPGQCLKVSVFDLMDIPQYEHNGTTFIAADRVLGNIVGSAYTHDYTEVFDANEPYFLFRRHVETGERFHEAPDRRGMRP